MKKSLFSLILCGLGLAQVSSSVAQCVVGGTDFDVTGTNLCAPILKSNGKSGGGGWYDDKLDWDKLCKGDMFIGPNAVDHKGLLSNTAATSGSLDLSDSKDIEKIFLSTNATQDASGVQYGKSTVTAQPKLINPFLKANETANNMFVNVGGKDRFPLLSYSMAGLEPGSTVTLECDVYDLFDITYFRYLNDTVCKGNGAGVPKMSDFMAGYNYVASTKEIGGGNKLEFAISSSADVKAGTTLFDPYNQNMLQRNNLSKETTSGVIPHGGSKHMTFSTKVPETGSLTFYFYKTSDCYKIPIGIDNIEIVGSIKPAITYTGNPCPEMPLRVFTKQTYPTGTKFNWKETVTGQTSSDPNFIFVPKAPDTDYTVTCEVTLPGCTPSKSEPLKIHSGVCCTSTDGAPMAMTNLFFDDFGNFVSDDTYEWTDRYGVTHTEKIPAGHTHYAQSITSTTSIPCVRAYNIESTGATLKVPYLKDEGLNKQLYDHGMYVVSAHGGYPSGVLNDNSGTTTGGMLQFDLDDGGSQDNFFEIDVEHICTGKEITFGADFASISEHPGCIEVQLLYGTTVLESDSKSFTGGSDGWKGVNKKFTIESSDVGGASEVTVKMKVRHDPTCVPFSPRGETRDYAIDNIIFSVCTPPDVNVESSVSTGKDILDLCTEDVLTLTSTSENSEALERFYLYSNGAIDPTKKIGYVYQYTFDDPSTESPTKKITWKTLHKNAEVLTEKKFDVDVNTYWDDIFSNLEDDPDHEKRIYFRVVVGEYSDLNADQSWKTTSAFSSCRKISISTIPIVAGLNCAACTKPDPVEFSADGGKFNATKKTVELCAGQSVVLGMDNAVHGIDKDGEDYSNYDVAWFKDDATSAAIESKKCVTGTDDAAPTITVDYADVEAAGATGVKYIISLHDYFDGTAPTSCDIKDTIIVIGNPKPIETLTDPDPFCEGTLAAEPTKTITGYDIQWFESDADTAKASEITAPVVGDVTKTESPKSYWYVLTDATTGCRGDANEYVITVNKADANPVSGKIEYMKTEAVGGALKPLDQQSTVLNTALAMTEYDLYVGLVSGATTQTAPELATSTLAAASTTVPSPAMVDPTSPDDEYLWYYTYLKSKVGGCLSDTVLVGVTIKGAPSPTTKDAAYCVNSANVAEMSTYAELALGTTGTLNFYDTDKTTLMAATDKPNVTTPGKYTYWASQTGAGGESSKQPIVIDVYGVNDVTLSESSHDYCLNDPTAVAVEAIASVATSTNDHIVNTAWEFFAEAANEPALNQPALGAATSMPVSTNVAGVYKYYARLKYDVSTVLPTSTEVCYGKHEEYTVTVQSVDPPTGTGSITYLKSEGPTFNMPLVQDGTAVVADAGCTLQWYDDAMSPITEAQAKPVYNSSLVGNEIKTYYVTQKNALGCESTPKTVTIMVSGYPTPSVTNLNVCENSPALAGTLQATANAVPGGDPASAFELVWYNSKADGTIDDATPVAGGIALSPTIQTAATDGSKTKEYKYFVLQQIIGDPAKASAPVPVTVTINTNPKLTVLVTSPKCKGESQDLSEMYNVSIENCEAQYSVGGTLTPSPKVVTEAGVYLVRGSYVINRGSALQETCASSDQKELNVVFHELDVDIVGSDRTCPNVGVALDADLHLGGGLTASGVTYSWTSDKNPTPAGTKTYNTGTTGLQNARDVVRVSLEVSSAACTGTRAVKKTHVITVGDGPLVGNIAFSETNNTEVKSYPVSSNGMMFNSCGGSVKVELSGIVNVDGGSYSLTGSQTSSGTFSSEASGDATLNLGAGTYMISYVNECPTKFEFEIVDKSAKSTQKNDVLTICENQTWSAEIIDLVGPSNTTIEWQHDGTPIPGETSTKLEFNPAQPSHSGVYTYSLFSAGCRFDGKIAMGSELTVKPYAKFDLTSFQNHYEIVNGDALNQPIGFLVPTTVSEIENDVKYTGAPIPNGTTLDIPSVDKDYRIHITAENDLYCKAETDVEVLVDARLVMIAELDTSTMCEGESHKLIVDTTGTGKVLHKDKLVLKATETVGTNAPTVLTLKPQGGKLVADISPRKDATYDVTYTYSVGSQDASLTTPLSMRVYEAMDVRFGPANPVCGDGFESTSISVTTSNSVEDLDWSDNTPGEVSGNMTGADITPTYTSSGVAPQFKRYKVIAKNSVCQPTPFYTTVEVHKPLEGNIVASSKICEFDPLTLDASSYLADTYEWVYEEKDSVMLGAMPTLVPDPDFANFSLKVTRGKCKAEDYVTVEVTFAPVVMQVDSITYKTIEIQLDGDGSTGPYMYIIDGEESDPNVTESLRSEVAYGKHTLKVVDQVGCFTETSFEVNSPAIKIPIIVSPDDNGVNDKFVVEGLAAGYPEAKVTIFDRWGKQLASYKAGDGTDWDGVYNGSKMPSTDYWYEIQIKEIQKTYTGHFTLIRQ